MRTALTIGFLNRIKNRSIDYMDICKDRMQLPGISLCLHLSLEQLWVFWMVLSSCKGCMWSPGILFREAGRLLLKSTFRSCKMSAFSCTGQKPVFRTAAGTRVYQQCRCVPGAHCCPLLPTPSQWSALKSPGIQAAVCISHDVYSDLSWIMCLASFAPGQTPPATPHRIHSCSVSTYTELQYNNLKILKINGPNSPCLAHVYGRH